MYSRASFHTRDASNAHVAVVNAKLAENRRAARSDEPSYQDRGLPYDVSGL